METRDNKLYDIYSNESALQEEMDRLRTQGYADEDMYIVSKYNERYAIYRGSTFFEKDEQEGAWFTLGDNLMNEKYFTQMGFSKRECNNYCEELQNGNYLLYVDKEYGPLFDSGLSKFGIDPTHASDYDSNMDTNYTKTDAYLYDSLGNIDNSLLPRRDNW